MTQMNDPQTESTGWSEPADADLPAPVPTQPAGSPITIQRFEDGISISVPPAGLLRGSRGLFLFALLWNTILIIMTVMFGIIALQAKAAEGVWIMPLAMSLFWLVGIGLLLAAINMGRRQAGLAIAGGTLMVLQTGLFGKKQREWPLDQIAAIGVGPSGMEVNDGPVLELQIHDADGKRLSLLAGRSDQELEWLAHELRQAAGLREYE
jgi:hypothetical protein